ncbi:MAG: IS701 family transposase [Cytophagaceae bacterium]|nr:MAG: IS701 family transposase [Cytophagaceae bacterium]
MTERNKRLLDLYTDYLLSSFGATTATGLSRLVPEVSHDQITRFLAQEPLSNKELWRLVKAQVRQVQSAQGVLIIDDTVQGKPYSDESELITWHYDHSVGRTVKGINLLSALYFSQGTSIPVAFELIQKTQLETNTKTGKDKWVCPRSKNEMAREMIAQFVRKQIPLGYVLADSWFSCAENMCFIKQKAHTHFIFPLKSNRKVALSAEDKAQGRWQSLASLDFETRSCRTLHLERVPFPVQVARHLMTNQEGQTGELFLCSSDVDLSSPTMLTIYQTRWKVEEYHKSLKQNAALAKSPTKLPHTQSNHIFASLIAFCKLETYRGCTRLNHFALKAKIYHAAIHSAFNQLQSLKATLPQPTA